MAKLDDLIYAPSAERALVATLLSHPEHWPEVETLSPGAFHGTRLRLLWSYLLSHGGRATQEALATYLAGAGHDGADAFVEDLVLGARSSDQIAELTTLVQEAAVRRQAWWVITAAPERYFRELLPAPEVVDGLIRDLTYIRVSGSQEQGDVSKGIEELEAKYRWALDNPGKIAGLKTGFRDVDALVQGLEPGMLVVVSSNTGEGKSIFEGQVARNLIEVPQDDGRTRRTSMFGVEMATREILGRLVVAKAGLDDRKVRLGLLNAAERQALAAAVQWLKDVIQPSFFYVGPDGFRNLTDLLHQARTFVRQRGADIVLVDYIQAIRVPGAQQFEGISIVAEELKSLATELHVPVLAISQVDRNVLRMQRGRATLADMFGSSSIEKYADLLLSIWRPERHLESRSMDQVWAGVAVLEILKARARGGGECYLGFNGAENRFFDLEPDRVKLLAGPLAQAALRPNARASESSTPSTRGERARMGRS